MDDSPLAVIGMACGLVVAFLLLLLIPPRPGPKPEEREEPTEDSHDRR